jgi:hypothetical protein
MTPDELASRSLNGFVLSPPSVGGSPLRSGGHVLPCSGEASLAVCATTESVTATESTMATAHPSNPRPGCIGSAPIMLVLVVAVRRSTPPIIGHPVVVMQLALARPVAPIVFRIT